MKLFTKNFSSNETALEGDLLTVCEYYSKKLNVLKRPKMALQKVNNEYFELMLFTNGYFLKLYFTLEQQLEEIPLEKAISLIDKLVEIAEQEVLLQNMTKNLRNLYNLQKREEYI